MSRDDIHEVGELDPENVGQIKELGLGFFVEVVCFCGGEESCWNSLRHAVAELAPEGAAVV